MKQESYMKIINRIKKSKRGESIVLFLNKYLTDMIYVAFIYLLFQLILEHRYEELVRIVLVTGISFVLVSVVRHFINAERPYTKYDFKPLINKEKTGDSMPSRHVFSAFVIGMAYLYINTALGVVVLIMGATIAVTRVLIGVHFPRDVIAGAVIGVLSGIIGFFVL